MNLKAWMCIVLSIVLGLCACDRAASDKPASAAGSAQPSVAPPRPEYTTPESVALLAFTVLQAADEKGVEPLLVTPADVTRIAERVPEMKEGLKNASADQLAQQLNMTLPESFKRTRGFAARKLDLAKATFAGLAQDSSIRKEPNGVETGYVRFAVKGADGKTYRFEVQDMIRFDRGWAGGGIGFQGEENAYLWGKVKTLLDALRERVVEYLRVKDQELGPFKGFAELDKIDVDFGNAPAAWAPFGPERIWMEKLRWPNSPASAACLKLETTAEGYVITYDSSKANIPGAAAGGTLSINAGGEFVHGGSAASLQAEK